MQEIREQLKLAIKELFDVDFDPDLTPSPENIPADFSTNAPLKLAKVLHKNPMEIGNQLKDQMDAPRESSISLSSPGFLNFIFPDEYLSAKIASFATNFDKNISWDEYSDKTVICEFSDPNPFKVLHVGHLYTSIVGDAISRLFEYAGAKVIRANFGGDVGLHVAKTMYILRQKPLEDLTIEDIARCYVEGTAAYEDDPAAHAEITKLNKEIYQINQENIHGTPLSDLYWKGRELSYAYFNQFYDQIGVKFDKFYPESTVADLGLKTVKEELEKGVYEMSDGAVVFRGDKFGLHTRVFINQEGIPTYETKDVGLIFTKWQDYCFDKSVVITGSEQSDYMKVVLKSVEQYAPDLVEKTTHLTHGLVKLQGNVKMSSRKGNFLRAVDVLDLVKTALKNDYNSTDPAVSLAATKYALIKYRMGGDIIFDPSESVKMTGNSGPYLLYSCVRAKKILGVGAKLLTSRGASARPVATGERRSSSPCQAPDPLEASNLAPSEHNLATKLLQYQETLQVAVAELAPHKLATYLYELAQEFSRFYENCPVSGSDRENERRTLVAAYLNVMTHGLKLLGIDQIPEEM